MKFFRAIPIAQYTPGEELRRHPGRRLPSNIPYMVDNLWEFTRPSGRPSRRHAVYASPSPELALSYAIVGGAARTGYIACEIRFRKDPAFMQLPVEDAKLHPDILVHQQFVNRKLGSWSALALDRKVELAPLFLPGITRAELLGAMGTSTLLDEVVREASALVTFWWLEGRMQETGELFFEIDDDNVYTLDPVEALAS
ncbi:hypothetical protein ABIB42_000318 [Massilia sp. UYP32]|jgi:hypothetical protein|uniref:RES domain-containing protein n=1 Tax=Massilia timonae CCUG 45783 TaxID=883126 RepID=K9DSU9_9BURK|nr:hypothetical protein [Massilia timonae]EKU81792.1 hypothetical protein HMPREF9710_02984 [Massilia timonae CCUG 45783]